MLFILKLLESVVVVATVPVTALPSCWFSKRTVSPAVKLWFCETVIDVEVGATLTCGLTLVYEDIDEPVTI